MSKETFPGKNIPKQEHKSKIIGPKALAFIVGMGSPIKENKIPERNPTEQNKILELQEKIKETYHQPENTELDTKPLETEKHFSEKEAAEKLNTLLSNFTLALKKEGGLLANFIRSKIEDNKEEILKSIYNIEEFKSENKQNIHIMENVDYYFSENEQVRNAQVNSIAVVHNLYINGGLEKICEGGLLLNISNMFYDENNLYSELKEYDNSFKLNYPEKRELLFQEVIAGKIIWKVEDLIEQTKNGKIKLEGDDRISTLINSVISKNPQLVTDLKSLVETLEKR
ncbi:MAG: hypothetical protein KBD52_02050 [Candidatus Pacebacteria bacterium]|nr:hypothetical protein [Candidatus Paceibacterota bacterium]